MVGNCRSNCSFFLDIVSGRFIPFPFIMKAKRTHSRKPVVVANSRWLAYATATTASAIACTPSAKAEIHYSGIVDHDFADGGFAGSLGPGVTFELNVGTGTWVGGTGFAFGGAFIRGTSQRTAGIFAGYGTGKAAYFLLSELPAGAFIPTQRFGEFCRWNSTCSCGVCYGTAEMAGRNFRAAGIGFIGFVFSHGGAGTQYGWARQKERTSGLSLYSRGLCMGRPGRPLFHWSNTPYTLCQHALPD